MRGRVICCFSLLTVLALAGEPLARGQVVGFDLYRDYLMVARGSAGPLKGLNFVIDTGASPSVLDRRVAQKLHLPESPASIAAIGGSVSAGQSVVPSLGFGPLRGDNFPVMIEDLSFFQRDFPIRIDGVIGLDLLGQSPFVIDYRAREIRFGVLPNLAASLPLHMRDGLPIVDGEVEHVPVQLLLDTGAPSMILFGRARPMKINATIGDFERKQVWLRGLELGQAEFGREPAFLVQRDGGDFDGLISPASLGITRVGIDVERGVLAFSR